MSAYGPLHLASPSGLVVQVNRNGSVRRIDHRDVMVNAFLGNELEGGAANLYLRRHGARVEWTALLGPRSPGEVRARRERHRDRRRVVGAALSRVARAGRIRAGVVLACRAGERRGRIMPGRSRLRTGRRAGQLRRSAAERVLRQPVRRSHAAEASFTRRGARGAAEPRGRWAAPLALHRIAAHAARASARTHSSFMGFPRAPAGRLPHCEAERLPGVRRQHEHSMAVLQDAPLSLAPGRERRARLLRLAGAGSSGGQRRRRPRLRRSRAGAARSRASRHEGRREHRPVRPRSSATHPCLPRHALDPGMLDTALRRRPPARPRKRAGELLSFFRADGAHVVLPAKERASLRPHGQILRTGDRLVPDEASLTTTVWMGGVFHSMVTQGHVSINRFLSTTHSYLGLYRSHGQRLFVERDGAWHLLGEPSAFEMTPSGARWLYAPSGPAARGAQLGGGRSARAVAHGARAGRRPVPLPRVQPRRAQRRRRLGRRARALDARRRGV